MNLQRLFFNTRKRMRKEGIKRQDFGCCPGHDKFPNHTYIPVLQRKPNDEQISLLICVQDVGRDGNYQLN